MSPDDPVLDSSCGPSERAAIRKQVLSEAADAWQTGGWTIVTKKVNAGLVLGVAQVVTDWLRERAEKE